MADEIRIKDLDLDDKAVEARFDAASFPVDLDKPDKTLRVTGSFWKRLFHPNKGEKGLDFTAKTLTAHGNTGSADFVAGLLGGGWNIDKFGNGELRSLKLREQLIVPELVKNQVSLSRNEAWFTDGGTIQRIADHTARFKWTTSGGTWAIGGTPIGSGAVHAGSYALTLKETPSFRPGDLLKAIVEHKNGFDTAQMRVDYLLGDLVVVRPLNGVLPVADMVVARVGNDKDKDRRWSIYVDALSGYVRVLADMSSFEVQLSNIKFQAGNLSGLRGLGYNKEIPPVGVYAPGLYIGTDQVAGLGAEILALEQSISLKVNTDEVINAINLDKSGVLISSNKLAEIKAPQIELEGYTSINNHFEVLQNGDVRMVNADVSGTVRAYKGEFWGHIFAPYTEHPDTTLIDGYWNLIQENWNIFDYGRYFALPTDLKYAGATISIINTWFEPLKSATFTVVKAQSGKIFGIGNAGSGIGSIANTVSFVGQELSFVGINRNGSTQWIVKMGGLNNITTT